MFVVRYVALVALVLWTGATITVLARQFLGDIFRGFDLLSAACGAIVFASLFVMKFVGPPPHSFVPRAALVFLMLAVTFYGSLSNRASTTALLAVNSLLGLVLLAWYVRE